MKTKFKKGDIVMHMASGEKGIVTDVYLPRVCIVHNLPIQCATHPLVCRHEITEGGEVSYRLSVSLEDYVDHVPEYLLIEWLV